MRLGFRHAVRGGRTIHLAMSSSCRSRSIYRTRGFLPDRVPVNYKLYVPAIVVVVVVVIALRRSSLYYIAFRPESIDARGVVTRHAAGKVLYSTAAHEGTEFQHHSATRSLPYYRHKYTGGNFFFLLNALSIRQSQKTLTSKQSIRVIVRQI